MQEAAAGARRHRGCRRPVGEVQGTGDICLLGGRIACPAPAVQLLSRRSTSRPPSDPKNLAMPHRRSHTSPLQPPSALACRPPRRRFGLAGLCAVLAGSLLTVAPACVPGGPAAELAEPTAAANHLIHQTSPYLRLHAHNPVDWYPWGDEALAKARQENKPIFLSIGYSSCHWCHVMERESFQDEEIAEFLNEHFVCIKVDREERPDVDAIYMTAVQFIARQGGWPLTAFLTPDGKPFFGGTYFPARDGDRGVGVGLLTIVRRVHQTWEDEEKNVRESAEQLTRLIRQEMEQPPAPEHPVAWDRLGDQLEAALQVRFDPDHGGFGYHPQQSQIPKFPQPSNLLFLLERSKDPQNQQARTMLITTLDHMARGGIWDHLAGGFHRYSTDRFWEVPHFEKMLYDNAQLASVYALAYELTGENRFRQTAAQTADFVLREMTSSDGAFYASIDAETDGEEGEYYRWSRDEVHEVLGEDQAALFAKAYGLDELPNFEEEFYVVHLVRPLEELADELDREAAELADQLAAMRTQLLARRQQREHPRVDTTVLTSWNGLMIRGLADTGRLLGERQYIDAAQRAAEFLLAHLRTSEGRLLRAYREEKAQTTAYLDDYATVIDGLIGLHQATGEARWLEAAQELWQVQRTFYSDEPHGGFFYTASDHGELIVRPKQYTDDVVPSGNSVSISNLAYLGHTLQQPEYLELARQAARAGAFYLAESPAAVPRLVLALGRLEP